MLARGGKTRAPVIQDDSDWNMMQVQLWEQVRRTKGKLNTICVTFDLDTMEGFKNHKQVSYLLSDEAYDLSFIIANAFPPQPRATCRANPGYPGMLPCCLAYLLSTLTMKL